jgi:dihydrofolate reductase
LVNSFASRWRPANVFADQQISAPRKENPRNEILSVGASWLFSALTSSFRRRPRNRATLAARADSCLPGGLRGGWGRRADWPAPAPAPEDHRPRRTLERVEWSNSILLKGDVAEEVAKLKAQEGGEIQVHGSGDLLQTLLKHDLIDALRMWQFPVVLGTGKRLFGEGTIPGSFRLVDTQLATTGAVLHVYERAGDLRYGEVEVGQETVIFE